MTHQIIAKAVVLGDHIPHGGGAVEGGGECGQVKSHTTLDANEHVVVVDFGPDHGVVWPP